ncbi:MAG: phospholipid carrier-dependent glycosyltransferase [Nitrospirae bacterium]|nr:phospholipid carrier-dependent glycosyltransferase [Nitrospirota bacterium]
MNFKKPYFYPLLVFLIPFIVYLPTLWGVFYYDDNVVFLGHQVKRLAENPFLVFSKDIHIVPGVGTPRSLHVFFLLVLYKVFGANPLPYHLFNLLFHSLTGVLIFLFLGRLTGKPNIALLAGIIFGLHPIHVENITFVTLGGTDLFYGFFSILSLFLYVLFRDKILKGRRNLLLLGLSVIAYFFSMLSKESAVTFIILYPLTEWLLETPSESRLQTPERSRWGYLWALPHLIALLSMKWDYLMAGTSIAVSAVGVGTANIARGRGIEDVILNLGFFIKSVTLPYPLSPFIKEFGNNVVLYSFALLSVTVVVLGIVLRKRLIAYGALWFIATSLPYLLVPLLETNLTITAERYIYAPSIGFAILLSSALMGLSRKRKLLKSLLAFIFLGYSIIGVSYFFSAWRSESAFWRCAIKRNPDYVSGYLSLAGIELAEGNILGAKTLIMQGLYKPKGMPAEFSQAAYFVGNIALMEGNVMTAESYYLLSLRYGPYEFSYIELGFLYLNTGNPERAKWAFENALGFPAQNLRAVYGLAKSYEMLGDKEKARLYALRVYERARDERLRAAASEILR